MRWVWLVVSTVMCVLDIYYGHYGFAKFFFVVLLITLIVIYERQRMEAEK